MIDNENWKFQFGWICCIECPYHQNCIDPFHLGLEAAGINPAHISPKCKWLKPIITLLTKTLKLGKNEEKFNIR